jgi:hypothetical protein
MISDVSEERASPSSGTKQSSACGLPSCCLLAWPILRSCRRRQRSRPKRRWISTEVENVTSQKAALFHRHRCEILKPSNILSLFIWTWYGYLVSCGKDIDCLYVNPREERLLEAEETEHVFNYLYYIILYYMLSFYLYYIEYILLYI